jgi:predicted  nucleic acid-binding Zn-ribbon protein
VDGVRRIRYEEQQLNAAPADQLRLLDVQAFDSQVDQLEHRRRGLPVHARIQQLSQRLTELRDLIVGAQTEEGDIAREQTKAESDVDQVTARAARDQQLLDSGRVGSARDLESLQHEIGSLNRRQAALEDVVLEVMERRETVQQRLTQLVDERDQLTGELADAEKERDVAVDDIDQQVAAAAADRADTARELPTDLLTLYEKLRAQHDGVGAAALHRQRCEGCRLELNSIELSRIRQAPPDEVLRCEECRRILIRTADSGL